MLGKILKKLLLVMILLSIAFLVKMAIDWYVLRAVNEINQNQRDRIEQRELDTQEQNHKNQLIQQKNKKEKQRQNQAWLEWYIEPDGCSNWVSDEHMVECVNHKMRAKEEFTLLLEQEKTDKKIVGTQTIQNFEKANLDEIIYSLCIDEFGNITCINILDQNPHNLVERMGGISVLKRATKKWEVEIKIIDGNPVAYNKLMRIIVD